MRIGQGMCQKSLQQITSTYQGQQEIDQLGCKFEADFYCPCRDKPGTTFDSLDSARLNNWFVRSDH